MDIRIVERNLNGRKRWIVCNGFKGRKEGYRAYVVNGLGEPKQVNNVDRRGAEWGRATHQVAEEGDNIIYRANGDDRLTVYELLGGELVVASELERRNTIRSIPLSIEEWLEVDESEHCKLPAGFGWDGERTGSEISKFDRVEGFFKRNHIPTTVRQMIKPYILETKGINMSTSWKQAHPLPESLRGGGVWVLWTKFNNPIVLDTQNGKTHPLPPRLTKAMFLQIYPKDYSVIWSLYTAPQGFRR